MAGNGMRMGHTLDVRVGHSKHAELGLLGQQIQLVIEASASSENAFWCDVQQKELTGEELLGDPENELRFLVYDSLPGTINIMAIGIDKQTVFVEISPYDPSEISDGLKASGAPPNIRVTADGMFFGRKRIASAVRCSKRVAAEHGDRVLWTIPRSLPEELLNAAIATLDGLDDRNVYELVEVQSASAAPAASPTQMKLEMRLGLQMELIQRQVPILSQRLGLSATVELRPEQIMDLQQLQRFEAWLERDPEQAILQAFERDPSPKGQARIANFIAFAAARDVKKVAEAAGQPISWPDARRVVRRILKSDRCSAGPRSARM
jgi:hypothetical protein